MPPETRKTRFTYEDYLLFPEDGRRHELVGGERFMTPAPSTKHQGVSRNLLYFLQDHLRRTKAGKVFYAPTDVVLSETDVIQPDLLFVAASRTAIITEKNIAGAPDLVVEIISKTTRKIDEAVKLKLYERHRVLEYWIVDPESETVAVHRLTDQGYVREAELSREAGYAVETPLLPGFRLKLSELFS